MSATYYNFYKRRIESHTDSKEKITNSVNDAHNKGRLTDKETEDLLELIEETYN